MKTEPVAVSPSVLAWARRRSGLSDEALHKKFPRIDAWESGDRSPTIKQLQDFAGATHTPLGFMFLPEPPVEGLPVPDFRTVESRELAEPSANLLDVIYECQMRQEWFADHSASEGYRPLKFVGTLTTKTPAHQAAATIREALGLATEDRGGSWAAAFSNFSTLAENSGCLVMTSGIVGSNTHRKLDPEEFRGFALADKYAPLIFINGADTKAAMVFTLAHELAHVWLGESGVDNPDPTRPQQASRRSENWCNAVAAELLVPTASLEEQYDPEGQLAEETQRLARVYKVSNLVVLSRLWDAELLALTWDQYQEAKTAERDRLLSIERPDSSGGNFYNTLPVRVSRRFATALVADTIEGRTPYLDAVKLLGFKSMSTFEKFSRELGVTP